MYAICAGCNVRASNQEELAAVCRCRRALSQGSESALSTKPADQIGGTHYQSLTPQPIEVIEAWGLGFHLANAVKYIARAGRKEGVSAKQDLEKAAWYLKRFIEIQKHESPAD